MIISVNKLVGSWIYRTREALNSNTVFMNRIKDYPFIGDCLFNGKFHLWYFPGTPQEISQILNAFDKNVNGSKIKFPAFFNYNTFRQNKTDEGTKVYLNLAAVARTLDELTTGERENKIFDLLLRDIYEEFINQIIKSKYVRAGFVRPVHDYYEVFSTGGNADIVEKRYGDHIDAIEMHNMQLYIEENNCERDRIKIELENNLVLEDLNNIIKQ